MTRMGEEEVVGDTLTKDRGGHLFETDLEYISLSLQDGGRNETH